MRNIEEIAAEEEALAQQLLRTRLRAFFLLTGLGLSLWGWTLFYRGHLEKGACGVMAGLFCWLLALGLLRVFRGSNAGFLFGTLVFLPAFGLYFLNRLPSFYWGKDPDFWYSVHTGRLGEPPWSPLCFLLGQSTCFLAPALKFSILPVLSALVLSCAVFLMAQDYYFQVRNKTFLSLFLCFLVCAAVAVAPPFLNVGTEGMGLVSGLGLLLFFFQKSLLSLEERPWKMLYFLLGLLCTVHPFWGLLGLLVHLGNLDREGKEWKENFPAFFAGLTPYLWIFFRAGKYFPSWGGSHPFFELFNHFPPILEQPFSKETLLSSLKALGWPVALLGGTGTLLWLLNFFRWRSGPKIQLSAFDFWVWVLSGLGGLLFYSPSSEMLGPTIVWFGAGLGQMFLRPLEKGIEKRQATFFSGYPLAWMGIVVLFTAIGLNWFPGKGPGRRQPFFPQQHAINLLQTLGSKALLVCHDPFDAAACREVRLIEPLALDAVVLEERYLNQRWYVSQVIQQNPEILFSNITETPTEVLKSIVFNNRDLWDVHWDLPVLPPDWQEPKSVPTILTQEFQGTTPLDPERAQYRFDFTALPGSGETSDPQSSIYFSLYVLGFNELGKYLENQGRFPAAIHAFERAIKLDPSFQDPQTSLARMYSQKNILEAARLEFEKTLQNHPRQIDALLKALETAQKTKDDEQAAALLGQVIHLNTELADAEYQLSKIYGKEGRAGEAKALLESSVNLNPGQLEAQLKLGHLMMGMGNRIKAEGAFRAVLEIDPQNKEAQKELWRLLNQPQM